MSVIGKLIVSIVGDIKGLEQALDTAEGRIAGVGKKLEEKIDTKAFLTVGAAITGVGLALGGVLVTTGLYAARVEVLKTSMEVVGKTAGYTTEYLAEQEEQIKDLGITTKSAREIMILLMQSEIDLAEATDLSRIAQDLAVISGENSSETARNLAYAIATGNPELLRRYGIMENLSDIQKEYGRDLTGVEKKEAILNMIRKKGITVEGVYETAMGDVGKQLTSLPRLIDDAKLAFGQAFIPVIGLAVDKLSELLKWFTDLSPETKTMITNITMLAAGIALVVGPILTIIGLLPTLAAGFAILLGPVGLVIAIVTALIAVGVLVWKNWDKIKAKAIEIWGAISKFFRGLWRKIVTIFGDALQSIWQWMLDWIPYLNIIVENWSKIVGFFSVLWENVKTIFITVWNTIVGFLGGIWDSIVTNVTKFKSRFLRIWDYIKEGMKGPINGIISLINSLLSKIESGINRMVGVLNRIGFKIPDWLGKIIPGLAGKEFGISISKIDIPNIPKLQLGGYIREAGFVDVGERGRERIFLPKAAQVIPLEKTISSINNYFNISELIVREEADIYKISKELYDLQKSKERGVGYK